MSTVVTDLNPRHSSLDFVSTSSPHDEYELIQRIGSGTYGDVYKVCSIDIVQIDEISFLQARHIPTASMRALKVIKLEAGIEKIFKKKIIQF